MGMRRKMSEAMVEALRRSDGKRTFASAHVKNVDGRALRGLEQRGLVLVEDGWLVLTNGGRSVLNAIERNAGSR